METNNTPHAPLKVISILAASETPVSKNLLIKWMQDVGFTDIEGIGQAIDEAVQSGDAQTTEAEGKVLYSIAPDKQAEVSDRLKKMIEQSENDLADAGLKMFGL